ncbi:hypothetical protein [Methylobacterium sp. E-045]|uniref:hypothetical protein n=1 Tax=Methylobacterium sp. E-045 TaxID=2836575 RepID=UPI001FBAC8A1|nr:hypothetical protein [Methylobacterium sp. E-045]MCJ2131599.1 hypothetical protein [Methylobacterium sp. E-045]
MIREACGFKVRVGGKGNRQVAVSAVKADSRPLVHLKMRDGIGNSSRAADTIDLDLSQANALANALIAAIKAAGKDPVVEEHLAEQFRRETARRAEDEAWEAASPPIIEAQPSY